MSSFTNMSNMLRMWTSYGVVEMIILKVSSLINKCLSRLVAHGAPRDRDLYTTEEEVSAARTTAVSAFGHDMNLYGRTILVPVKHLLEHMWRESQLFTYILFGVSVMDSGLSLNFSHLANTVYWISSNNMINNGKFENMYRLEIPMCLPVFYYYNLFHRCKDDSNHYYLSSNKSDQDDNIAAREEDLGENFLDSDDTPVRKYVSQLYTSDRDCDVVMVSSSAGNGETCSGSTAVERPASSSMPTTVKSSDEEFEFKDNNCTRLRQNNKMVENSRKRIIVSKRKNEKITFVKRRLDSLWGDSSVNTIVGGRSNNDFCKNMKHKKQTPTSSSSQYRTQQSESKQNNQQQQQHNKKKKYFSSPKDTSPYRVSNGRNVGVYYKDQEVSFGNPSTLYTTP